MVIPLFWPGSILVSDNACSKMNWKSVAQRERETETRRLWFHNNYCQMHTPPTPVAPRFPASFWRQTIYERFNAAADTAAAFKIIFLLSTHVFRVSFLLLQHFVVFLFIFRRLFALAWAFSTSYFCYCRKLLLIFIREKHFRFFPSGQSQYNKFINMCVEISWFLFLVKTAQN